MADLATLALRLESSQLVQGSSEAARSLGQVAAAGDQAAAATQRAETATQRLGREMSASAKMLQQMGSVGGPNLASLQANEKLIQGLSASGRAAAESVGAVGKAAQLTAREIAFMGFQFQDIAVTAAMGMNPMMIALQQGTQIVQTFILRGMTLRQAITAIGPAIMQFITSPFMLAVAAVGAFFLVLQKAFQWLTGSGGQSAEDRLSAHTKAVQDLTKAYQDMGIVIRKSGGESIAVLERMTEITAKGVRRDLLNQSTSLLTNNALRQGGGLSLPFLGSASDLLPDSIKLSAGAIDSRKFGAEATAALEQFRRETLAGVPDVLKLRDALDEALNNPDLDSGMRKNIESILSLTTALADLQRATQGVVQEQNRFVRAYQGSSMSAGAFIQSMGKPDMRGPSELLGIAFQRQMDEIDENAPNAAAAAVARRQAQKDYKEAQGQIILQEQRMLEMQQLQMQAIRAKTSEEKGAIAARMEELRIADQAMDPTMRYYRIEGARMQAIAQSEYAVEEATRKRVESMQKSIAQGELELSLTGKTVEEATRLRIEFQLTEEAKRAAAEAGGVVSPEELSLIRQTADEIGRLAAETARVQLARDAAFQRSQLGRTSTEQQVASTLRSAGLPTDDDYARWLENQAKLTEQLSFTKDLAGSAMKGFIGDLRQGATLADALANALDRVISRLTDRLIDALLSGVWPTPGVGTPPGGGASNTLNQAVRAVGSSIGLITNAGAEGETAAILARSASTASLGGVERQVADFWLSKGLAPHQVAGIMGNMYQESRFNPLAVGDGGNAFGLFQHNDRRNALFSWLGGKGNLGNVGGQLGFAHHELMTSENASWQALLRSTNVREATAAFGGFERPSGFSSIMNPETMHGWANRLAEAEKYAAQLASSSGQLAGTMESVVQQTAQTGSNFVSGWGDALGKVVQGVGGTPAGGGSSGGGLFGWLGGLFGGGGSGSTTIVGGLFHGGGTVGLGGVARLLPATAAVGAPRYHSGLAADERVAILQTGEQVLSRQEVGRQRGGGMVVNINDHRSGSSPSPEVEDNGEDSSGRRMLTVTVRDDIASGRFDRAFRSRYGAKPVRRRR